MQLQRRGNRFGQGETYNVSVQKVQFVNVMKLKEMLSKHASSS